MPRWVRRDERGSALIIAVIIVSVLALAAAAILRISSNDADAMAAKRRHDKSVSCADAAQQMLISQFRMYGLSPTEVTLDRIVGDQRMKTGHYDTLTVGPVERATGAIAKGFAITDGTNRIGGASVGGQMYRMTVHCGNTASDAGVNQSEVEFLVRFGL